MSCVRELSSKASSISQPSGGMFLQWLPRKREIKQMYSRIAMFIPSSTFKSIQYFQKSGGKKHRTD